MNEDVNAVRELAASRARELLRDGEHEEAEKFHTVELWAAGLLDALEVVNGLWVDEACEARR